MRRLQDAPFWLVGGAVTAVLIVAVSWVMFIGPELSSAKKLHAETTASNQWNRTLQAKARTLEDKSTHVAQYTSSLRRSQAAIPYDSGLPAFTLQLNAQAKAHKVSVTSVTVGAVTEIVPPAGGAATGSTPPASDGKLYSMQVTVQSEGSFENQLAFLEAIRSTGARRALVTGVQASSGGGARTTASIDGSASFSAQMDVFSAPQPPAQIARLGKLLRGELGN